MFAIDKTYIQEIMEAFSESTGVPASFYLPNGVINEACLSEKKICKFFEEYHRDSECTQSRVFSMHLANEMGEPYIYHCPGGLVHIAAPLVVDGEYQGCIVAGPLAMEESDEQILEQAVSLDSTAPPPPMTKAAMFITRMPRYSSTQIQRLALLLYSAVYSGDMSNRKHFEQLNARHKHQLAMGVQLQERKRCGDVTSENLPTIDELELRLIQLIQERNREASLICADALIQELVIAENGSLDSVKLHLMELFISLAREAVVDGIPLRRVMGKNFELIESQESMNSPAEIRVWVHKNIQRFTDEIFINQPQLSKTTTEALAYIADHYMEKITLKTLASHLFVSEHYLSKLFRQEMDTSFTDYLSRTRIERSIELLQDTDMSLLEIAGLVGFEDQSYFTKVFKRITNETPRQYKTHLLESAKEA